MPRLVTTLVLIAAIAPLTACEDETARNEAMLFLDRFEDVDVDDELEERRISITQIREMVITDHDVDAARDACVDAYDALIEAEDQHALARHLLVQSGGTTEMDVPPEVALEINAAIDHSDDAISRSRELFPRCNHAVTQLERRYPRQRAGH